MAGFFVIVFGAVGFGFLLIFLLALSERRKHPAGEGKPVLNRERFEKACVGVVEGMRLEIDEINRSGRDVLDIMAHNPTPIVGGEFLVHCIYVDPAQVIHQAQILELSNMVLQERISKGIFITTGRFTPDIPTIGELAPMEFIDGPKFQELMDKYKIIFAGD